MSAPTTTRPRARTTLLRALIAAATLGAGAREAQAQAFLDLPIPGIGPPPLTGDIEQAEKRAFWKAGQRRWFLAATVELGNLYGRSGAAVGYGRPHWSWVGVEGSSSISPGGAGAYGGFRVSSSFIDVRAGARYTTTMGQHFLAPRSTYTFDDIESEVGPRLRYVTLEAEAASGFPLLRGSVFGVLGVYRVLGAPQGWNLFEQSLQVVTEPTLLWRARLGYLARIDRWDMFRLGAAAEVIGNPDRGSVVVRAGPAITAMVTHHLEAFGAALLVVSSPDTIGLAGSQIGEVGFRYRWATGDRWPEIP